MALFACASTLSFDLREDFEKNGRIIRRVVLLALPSLTSIDLRTLAVLLKVPCDSPVV